MNIKIILFTLLFSTLLLAENKLKVDIKLEKQSFYLSEDILLLLSVKNQKENSIDLDMYGINSYLKLEHEGNLVDLTIWIGAHYRFYILPQDSLLFPFNLTVIYGDFFDHEDQKIYGLPMGNYSIKFMYKTDEVELLSNSIKFQIKDPDKKNIEAFNMYNELYYSYFISEGSEVRKQKKRELLNVYKKFPHSIFAPISLGKNSSISETEINEQIIREFPDRFVSLSALRRILYSIRKESNKLAAEAFLEDIAHKNRNDFIGKVAASELKKLQLQTLDEWLGKERYKLPKPNKQ